MNAASIILAILIFILFVWAVRSSLKHPNSCSGDCSSCHTACSSGSGQTPHWLEAYRKDHPKEDGIAKKKKAD